MFNKISIVIGLLVVTGLAVTAVAASQHRNSFKMDRVSASLDLDQQQQVELQALLVEMQGLKDTMHEQGEILHSGLQQQLRNEQFDTPLFQNQLDAGIEQFKQQLNLRVQKFADFHASLSSEQREKLATIMQEHKGKHKKGGHQRWGKKHSS